MRITPADVIEEVRNQGSEIRVATVSINNEIGKIKREMDVRSYWIAEADTKLGGVLSSSKERADFEAWKSDIVMLNVIAAVLLTVAPGANCDITTNTRRDSRCVF